MAEAAVLLALLQAVTQALTEGALKSLIGFKHHVPNLHDIKKDLEKLKGELESIKPVLNFVDSMNNDAKKEVQEDMVVFASQLRKQAYKLEDTVDELMNLIHHYDAGGLRGHTHNVRTAMYLSRDSSTFLRIGKEINHIYSNINEITKRRKRYRITYPNVVLVGTSSNGGDGGHTPCLNYRRFNERANLVGIEQNEKTVLNWLMDGHINLILVSICGMGGLGKTTLVSTIYDHPEVKRHFEFRAWVPISQSWDMSELLMFIAKKLNDGKDKNIDYSSESINQSLITKRYLIVLDDVWENNILDQFISILPNNSFRSRIIITSRTHDLKSNLPTKLLKLEPLKEKEAQHLFFKVIFGTSQCPKEELVGWGEKIAQKCEGLPLGIVTIGRFLASQNPTQREWERMYNSLQWELTNNKDLKGSVECVLMLSYYKLPNNLKRCFLYCALFPEDYAIKKKLLVHLWIAEGFIEEEGGRTLEEIGERYVDMLIQRSMLQVIKRSETGKPKSCKVHDLMRELALAVAKGENFYVTKDVKHEIKDSLRRLSINERTGGVLPDNSNFLGLRTLLIFKGGPPLVKSLSYIYPKLNLLRVLNLRGLPIDKIPDKIFKLFNLRFLSLRETKIREVPSSLEDLYNLQTLDLWKTNVDNLPRQVLKLGNLRHLFVEELDAHNLKYRNVLNFRGSEAPMNIGALKQLQTLRNIKADNDTLTHLESLTQLKSLCITQLDRNTGNKFCESISKMTGLLRLSIKATNNSTLVLDNISPPSNLEKLIVNGNLATVPRWFKSLQGLTQLYLIGSRLREGENLIIPIQKLSNLVRLALDEAYMGRILCFPKESFPSLKTLYLANMNMLVKVVIEKGALAVLSRFHVSSCEHLVEINGIELLTNLTDLKLKMLPHFTSTKIQGLSIY